MRIFEIILILVNFFSLLLSFKKQSKAARLGAVALNIILLLIHGFLEGLRYQMIFSYAFVGIYALYTLLKTKNKFLKVKTPMGIKVIAGFLCFIFLGGTTILSCALPVFKLPKPTGSYDVGIKYLHLVDENRNDPFLDKSSKKRELMVKVYYPGKMDNSKEFDGYFHNSSELIKAFAAGYGLPDFLFNHIKLVKTNSKVDLQVSDKEQSYPVVLFSHGGGTTMEVQTSQCEDLASQGYIVVAIDHTFVSWATLFPDKIVSAKEATTYFKAVEPAEIITEIMAEDSKFVIESLSEMNKGKITSGFKGRLNLDKIGAIGHSLGGATAYNLAINDNRVKAAINLDGRVYTAPKDKWENMAPLLMLANDDYFIQSIQSREGLLKKYEDLTEEEQKNTLLMYESKETYNEAYRKEQKNVIELVEVLKESGNLFTIEGSDHMKFTDIGLFIGSSKLRELMGISGKTEPERCLEITKELTVRFFDEYLKSEDSLSPNSLLQRYPELKNVDLK